MSYTKEQLYDTYHSLPEEIQDVMASMDTTYSIRTIGQKHQLHIDKVGELADEIGLVMFGLVKPDQFMPQIQTRLGVDQATANAITKEVNEQIFLPIRESLQGLASRDKLLASNLNEKQETPEASEAITPPSGGGGLDKDTVFEKKLGQLFRIPREEIDLDPYLEKPE